METKPKNIHKLYNSCIKLKSGFHKYFSNIMAKYKITLANMPDMNNEYINICEDLIFGVDDVSYDKNKKTYLNKYKNLVKTILWNKIVTDQYNGLGFLNELVILIEEFSNNVANNFHDFIPELSKNISVYEQVEHISDLLFSYAWDTTHIRNQMSVLRQLSKHYIFDATPNSVCKKDSLKRYYFNHVYGLKNSVKVFDENNLPFGATNQIMKVFDEIIEYIFTEFVATYQSTLTILEDIRKISR